MIAGQVASGQLQVLGLREANWLEHSAADTDTTATATATASIATERTYRWVMGGGCYGVWTGMDIVQVKRWGGASITISLV